MKSILQNDHFCPGRTSGDCITELARTLVRQVGGLALLDILAVVG